MLKSMELAKVVFIKAFFISFVALAATDSGLLLYSYNTGSPPPDWGVLGRWFVILLHGRFYVPQIAQEPSVSREHFIGFLLHQFTAFVFAVVYLWVMRGKSFVDYVESICCSFLSRSRVGGRILHGGASD